MSNELHKKYEVTCWESNKKHGVIKPFDTYSEAVEFLELLDKSKFDTIKVQQTTKLYSKGELLLDETDNIR